MVQRTLQTVYCIDTSALINIWRVSYPPDVFPGLVRDLEDLIDEGLLLAPSEVLAELKGRDDELLKWARAHERMFKDLTSRDMESVRRILRQFPDLVDPNKTTADADPFLIALAMDKGWTVVTSERPRGRSGRPRIPDVCGHFGVRCIGLMDLLRERSWKYERA
jgi:hypothetical protein